MQAGDALASLRLFQCSSRETSTTFIPTGAADGRLWPIVGRECFDIGVFSHCIKSENLLLSKS